MLSSISLNLLYQKDALMALNFITMVGSVSISALKNALPQLKIFRRNATS
jgi:hypothetical protein